MGGRPNLVYSPGPGLSPGTLDLLDLTWDLNWDLTWTMEMSEFLVDRNCGSVGLVQTKAISEILDYYGISDNVVRTCQDTTSANAGNKLCVLARSVTGFYSGLIDAATSLSLR